MDGQRPLLDFTSRSPLYHYILGYWMELFGYSLLSARIFIVLTQVCTTVCLYYIGRALFSTKVGLFSAAVFAFNPFFIYWGYVVKTEPLTLLIAAIAMLLVIRTILNDYDRHLLLTGVAGTVLGLGYLVRATLLIYLVMFVVMYAIAFRQGLLSRRTALTSSVVVTTLFLVSRSVFALVYEYPLKVLYWDYRNPLAFIGLVSTPGQSPASPPTDYTHLRIFYDVSVMNMSLFVLVLLGIIGYYFYQNGTVNRYIVVGIGCGFALPVFLLFAGTTSPLGGFGTTNMTGQQSVALTILFVLAYWTGFTLSLVVSENGETPIVPTGVTATFGFRLAVLLSIFIFLFYAAKGRVFAGYFLEQALAVSLIAGVVLRSLRENATTIREEAPIHATIFILCIVVSLSLAVFIYAHPDTTTNDRQISVETVNSASEFIQTNSDPSQEIFTKQPVFAIDADRRNMIDLGRKINRYPVEPTQSEVISYLETNDVKYVVLSPRTRDLLAENKPLSDCILNNYEVVKQYKDDTAGIDKTITIIERTDSVSC
jgi:4-amino-4-deoxy-L-arabinose transferase-like glycosyltransferase